MGLNTLLRLISVTLLAFVLVVLLVRWTWMPPERAMPAIELSRATLQMSLCVPWLEPTDVKSLLQYPHALGNRVIIDRTHASNRFIEIVSGAEATGRRQQRDLRTAPTDGAEAHRPTIRVSGIVNITLYRPMLGLLLMLALAIEGIRLWRRRCTWARPQGPLSITAVASLVAGLTMFGLVVVTLTVPPAWPVAVPFMPQLHVMQGFVQMHYRPLFARADDQAPASGRSALPSLNQRRSLWDEPGQPVLNRDLVRIDRIPARMTTEIPSRVSGAVAMAPSQTVARTVSWHRLTVYPPFFAVLLVVAVGLLAKGQQAITALGGRAGFRVERLRDAGGEPTPSARSDFQRVNP